MWSQCNAWLKLEQSGDIPQNIIKKRETVRYKPLSCVKMEEWNFTSCKQSYHCRHQISILTRIDWNSCEIRVQITAISFHSADHFGCINLHSTWSCFQARETALVTLNTEVWRWVDVAHWRGISRDTVRCCRMLLSQWCEPVTATTSLYTTIKVLVLMLIQIFDSDQKEQPFVVHC